MLEINNLRNLCCDKNIVITRHANTRLKERNITLEDVKRAIQTGEIIKQYEDDTPFPSCLLLGNSLSGQVVHAVLSIDDNYLYVITAYFPDESEWESDLKTRKGH